MAISEPRLMDNILPKNATAYERVMAQNVERLLSLGVPFSDLWNPEACPVDFLPFLAWTVSVDVWNDDWPEEKKRHVIGNALSDHKIKGTLALHERYIAYAGSELLKSTTAPQTFFAGSGDDDPLYREWLNSLPEVKIHTTTVSGTAINLLVSGYEDDMFPSEGFLSASNDESTTADDVGTWFAGREVTADERIEATITQDGIITPLTVTTRPDPRRGKFGTVRDIAFDGTAGRAFFTNDVQSVDGFLGGAIDGQTITLKFINGSPEQLEWNLFNLDDEKVQDVAPMRIEIPGFASQETFADQAFEWSFLDADDPERDFYYSLRAFNKNFSSPSASFLDYDRISMKPFTAEFAVSVIEPAVTGGLYVGGFANASHTLPPTDLSKLWAATDAAVAAKSLRDTILFDLDLESSKTFAHRRTLAELKL